MSVDRPATSKSRGICRYYNTPRGCFAGDLCKFQHGEHEKLTPFDKSKTCKFFAAGFCRRGAQCWFKHAQPEASTSSTPQIPSAPTVSTEAVATEEEDLDNLCSICLEKPITYGLLGGCSHIFCVHCIKEWRDPNGKSDDVVSSGNTKKCPLCRVSSRFVTPSSRFYPEGHPGKAEIIERYKASMARVPCRYFRDSPSFDRFCPFGKDCFYQHQNEDGTPYIFDRGVDHYMKIYQRRLNQERRSDDEYGTGHFLNPLVEDFGATLDAIRASLPNFVNQLHYYGDDDNIVWDDFGEERRPDTPRPADEDTHVNGDLMQRLVHSVSEFLSIWPANEDDRVTFHVRAMGQPEEVHGEGSRPRSPESTPEPDVLRLLNAATITPTGEPSMPSWSEVSFNVQVEGMGVPSFATPSSASTSAHLPASTPSHSVSHPTPVLSEGDIDLLEMLRRNSLDYGAASTEDRGPVASEHCEEAQSDIASADEPVSSVASNNEGPVSLPSGSNSSQEPIVVQDADPPFLTDGRGRVVWSNASQTRHRAARSMPRQQPKGRHEPSSINSVIPRDTPRTDISAGSHDRPHTEIEGASVSSADVQVQPIEFVTDGRGRVISTSSAVRQTAIESASKDALDDDGAGLYLQNDVLGGDVEEDEDDSEAVPSFLGRLWNVFFL